MRYSAKDLICRSSRQLVYFSQIPSNIERKKKAPSEWMKMGDQFQQFVHDFYFPTWYSEMRGIVTLNNSEIFFSNDICVENKYIEVKWLCEEIDAPDWFFKRSIFQCAVYKSLLSACKILHTAKFAQKSNGYHTMQVPSNTIYYLWFGADVYEVDVTMPEPFINFISDKISSLRDYYAASDFDNKYKFKEYDSFKEFIKVHKLTKDELSLLTNK